MDDDSKMPAKKGAKRSAGNQEETKQSSGAAAEPTAADKRRKDKQLPSRPLSAYNLFFKEERVIILENQKKGVAQPDFVFPTEEELKQQVAAGKKKAPKLFQALARCIGQRWRNLPRARVQEYDARAKLEMAAYRQKMAEYQETVVEKNIGDNEGKEPVEETPVEARPEGSRNLGESHNNEPTTSSSDVARSDQSAFQSSSLTSQAQLSMLTDGMQQLSQFNVRGPSSAGMGMANPLQTLQRTNIPSVLNAQLSRAGVDNTTPLSMAQVQQQILNAQLQQLQSLPLDSLRQLQVLHQHQQQQERDRELQNLQQRQVTGADIVNQSLLPSQLQDVAAALAGAPHAIVDRSQLLAQLQLNRIQQQQHAMASQLRQQAELQQLLRGGVPPFTASSQLQRQQSAATSASGASLGQQQQQQQRRRRRQ
mmetsp:Transcript_6876/g.19225  ORF Transcript_6876/g.19225 Transcript_6876/m.19225 type:complete len:423 (+) Transcript_6876:349-1617(+)